MLTDAGGDTVANVAQTATVALPAGAISWQADLLTKEGHGAGVDQQGNPGISGLFVQSPNGSSAVYFSVFDNNSLNVGTTVNGVWQGWTRVGTAPTVMHAGGPEMLWHTYQIQLDAGGTFSVYFDGNALRSGISAGQPSAWAGGIGSGTLFTQSNLDERHLSTYFDGVWAFGADAPRTPAGPGGARQVSFPWNDAARATSYNLYQAPSSGNETLLSPGLTSTAFANFDLSTGTPYFNLVTAVKSAEESVPAQEVSATEQAMVWVPDDGRLLLDMFEAASNAALKLTSA
jgi:hypothetical protein